MAHYRGNPENKLGIASGPAVRDGHDADRGVDGAGQSWVEQPNARPAPTPQAIGPEPQATAAIMHLLPVTGRFGIHKLVSFGIAGATLVRKRPKSFAKSAGRAAYQTSR